MSRLDAEYDPTEHHDLDRIDELPQGSLRSRWEAVCACGWRSGSAFSRGLARRDHENHRDDALGIGCA